MSECVLTCPLVTTWYPVQKRTYSHPCKSQASKPLHESVTSCYICDVENSKLNSLIDTRNSGDSKNLHYCGLISVCIEVD